MQQPLRTFASSVALPAVTLLLATALPGQHVLYTFHGEGAQHLFGASVRGTGDIDRDGYDDFIAGGVHLAGKGRARLHSGKDGRVLYSMEGEQTNGFFGVAVAGAGDIDADGYLDFLVGESKFSVQPGKEEGKVRVFSGKDGSVLRAHCGVDEFSEFGFSVNPAGDVNQDGHDDYLIGAFLEDAGGLTDAGVARCFSGKDGSVLYRFAGTQSFSSTGLSVLGPGDIDKDGFPDLFVGSPRENANGRVDSGMATLYSGKDGSVLFQFKGDSGGDELGFSICAAGDIDQDGFLDLLVGIPRDDNTSADAGSARVYSGKDGSALLSFDGANRDDWFGWAVSGGGDLNGDGVPDIVIGAFFDDTNGNNAGSVDVYSGKDGTLLNCFRGKGKNDWYGQAVAMLGDVNRDGLADYIIGAERENVGANDSGTIYVMSGKRLSLATDRQLLPFHQAGTQTLNVDMGPTCANDAYWIFGSVRGMHPARRLFGVPIFLIPDSYTRVVMSNTNTATYSNFRGTLDATGKAMATFNIPNGLPASAISLYHAAVVFQPTTGVIVAASNSAPIRLH